MRIKVYKRSPKFVVPLVLGLIGTGMIVAALPPRGRLFLWGAGLVGLAWYLGKEVFA